MSDFRITEPGWFKTRCGGKAEVLIYSLRQDCWIGFNDRGRPENWASTGQLVDRMAHESALSGDLVAPWSEPKKGQVWVVVVPRGNGTEYSTTFETVAGAEHWVATNGFKPLAMFGCDWVEGEGILR